MHRYRSTRKDSTQRRLIAARMDAPLAPIALSALPPDHKSRPNHRSPRLHCQWRHNTPPTTHGWKPSAAMHGSATVRTFSPVDERSSRRIARRERSPQPASGWEGRSALQTYVIRVQCTSRLHCQCRVTGAASLVTGGRNAQSGESASEQSERCCTRELVTTRRAAPHLINPIRIQPL